MRGLRGSVRFVSLVLAALTAAGSASAQLLIATPADVGDSVAHAELAYAVGDGPPVTWVSLRVRRAPVVLVAALPEGASAEVALDAWLSALEASASPRVLLPRDTTDCGEASFVEVTWPRSAGAMPDELRLESAEDVASVLAEQGLVASGELPSASAYLVWSWSGLTTARTTRTLRIRGGASPLSFLPGSPFPILLNAVTRGAATYAGEVDGSALDVTFIAGPNERSDYRARVEGWLAGPADPLLETRSHGLLYDWSIHSDLVSLAPLTRTYAVRAAAELPGLDDEACGNALAALRVTASEPQSEPEACGSARDAALALQAADPELATLQRFVISGAHGVSAESLSGGGLPRAPTLRAKLLDTAACPEVQQPPKVVDPVVSGGAAGGARQPRGDSEVIVEETVVVEQHQPVEVDCTGSPQPEPDGGYDDDDVDCSSDTSSSSDTDGSEADCSADTTASEPEGDDASCTDDTSSSSASDDSSCDGGPSDGSEQDDGYDGDTCASVSATPRATQESRAGLTRSKRLKGSRRLKTSLWSVAFAALALPIRRRKRGARNT